MKSLHRWTCLLPFSALIELTSLSVPASAEEQLTWTLDLWGSGSETSSLGFCKLKLKPSSSSLSDGDYFRTIRWTQDNASVATAAELTLQTSLCLSGIFPGCRWFFFPGHGYFYVYPGLQVHCQTDRVVLPWKAVKYRRHCMGGDKIVLYILKTKMK